MTVLDSLSKHPLSLTTGIIEYQLSDENKSLSHTLKENI